MATIIIPARYNSSRLPGKPLCNINGKPMILQVYDRCKAAKRASRVIIATDDCAIRDVAHAYGCQAVMTGDHNSGSDRVAYVAKHMPDDELIVNVQGDLPFVDPLLIDNVITEAENCQYDIVTPAKPKNGDLDLFYSKSTVKVVFDHNYKALLFSRSPLPSDDKGLIWHHHIGLYAWRNSALQRFTEITPPWIETAEQLEQLRALYHGFTIKILVTYLEVGQEINTQEDLAAV